MKQPFLSVIVAGLASLSCVSLNAQLPDRSGVLGRLSSQTSDRLEGFTEPYRDIQLGSSDTGTISEIRVEEGKQVHFGQVIAKLDDRVYQANVTIARQAASSTGELEAAQVQFESSQRRFDQLAALHGRNHATDQELLSVGAARDEAQARLKAYQELSVRRQQELKQAEMQLNRMTIVSPMDGMVVKCMKDVGEVVSPADPALVRIVQLDPLRISASASITQAQQFQIGQVLIAHVGGTQKSATVEFISPVADVSSGTTMIQLRIPNNDHKLLAGLPCQIELPSSPEPNGKSVPRQTRLPGTQNRY